MPNSFAFMNIGNKLSVSILILAELSEGSHPGQQYVDDVAKAFLPLHSLVVSVELWLFGLMTTERAMLVVVG